MAKRFLNKIAVVTGSSSGIGAAISRLLVAEGGRVVGGDISAKGNEKLAAELGGSFVPVTADVTKEKDVEALVGAAKERFGALHLGFNAAGAARGGSVADVDIKDWDFTVDICLKGTLFSVKHQARAMGPGSAIVNIASLNAHVPGRMMAAYTVAKAGVEMLSRNAALELAERGIRVNAVLPGLVASPMTDFIMANKPLLDAYLERIPIGRPATPEDIAKPCLFLASDDAAYVTGASLLVDGAWNTSGYPDLRKYLTNLVSGGQDK
ncbi:3-oxoacyl-reductase [Hyaloraphidium curvatum]|nr:3-oxoacyl-reductase [Hyaloraphidium curvatum]